LTEAEAAFRIQKSDLAIRPIWHQREDLAPSLPLGACAARWALPTCVSLRPRPWPSVSPASTPVPATTVRPPSSGGGAFPRTHPRIEAYGTIDELNSVIGLARVFNAKQLKRGKPYR
jgi:hypothetical protein